MTVVTLQPLGQPGQAPLIDPTGRPTPQFAQWLSSIDRLAQSLNALCAPLNTLNPINVANVVDTTSITPDYSSYMIMLQNIVPQSSNFKLFCRVSTDGGATYKTNTYLSLIAGGFGQGTGGPGSANSADTTGIILSDNNINLDGESNSASQGLCGTVFLHNPLGTTMRKFITGSVGYFGTVGNRVDAVSVAGFWDGGNNAINALQFFYGSGNIVSGTIKIYGLK